MNTGHRGTLQVCIYTAPDVQNTDRDSRILPVQQLD